LRKILMLKRHLILLLLFPICISAQNLDPRAYARVPIDMTFIGIGFNYSYGNVLLDPSLPLKNLDSNILSPSIGIGHTMELLGFTTQLFAALPYAWADVSATLEAEDRSLTRSGLGDMRIRISILLLGAKPVSVQELMKKSPQFVLGTSLTVTAPTGQFFPNKLINLGTNRWSFKPEIGISYPFYKKWFIDLYAGIWFFTNNDSFFPGNSVRSQQPLGSFQTHLSYNFSPAMWAAIDFTYYTGGQSSVNGLKDDDDQNNVRMGATFNFPITKNQAIKLAYSTGAIIRFGADFSTISAAWQIAFL
jgi:hypothetical protein